MNTNDLINRLGANLAPVEPLPAPGRRALLWMSGGAAYLVVVVLAVALFTPAGWAFDAEFIGTQLLGILAGGLAVWAAFLSVIPGHSRRLQALALLAAAAWLMSFFLLAAARDGVTVLASQPEWVCVAMILLGGAPLVLSLGVMLRKGAPINPLQSSILIGIAVGLLTNFAACLSSPHSDMSLALLWHLSAIAALIVVCVLAGSVAFSWRNKI